MQSQTGNDCSKQVAELDTFQEVAGCGTAVVMMGIKSLTLNDRVWK